jgi:hypothetical protein
MAKATKKPNPASPTAPASAPRFPYATTPNALRKFLELVPNKPKPPKVNADLLRAWGLKNTNDQTLIRVLKALKLVGANNEPTERYTEYMSPLNGPGVLAEAAREVWAPLFISSHEPHREDDRTLRNYFNVHSGGSEGTIALQIQTFKAVADHADFGAEPKRGGTGVSGQTMTEGSGKPGTGAQGAEGGPQIHIDLHIHLPENKSRRDYEYIFEDIARYIFGRDVGGNSNDRD